MTDLPTSIRTSLATIRRAWPHLTDPDRPTSITHPDKPGSKPPTQLDALSLTTEITRDLAFWVDAFIRTHDDALHDLLDDWRTIDAVDVPRTCRFLTEHADTLAEWDRGARLDNELHFHAQDARTLAWPRIQHQALGPCPVDVDGAACGRLVRVKPGTDGATCPACKTSQPIDWWFERIVGRPDLAEHVTGQQLVIVAAFTLGVVVQESTLRQWVRRRHLTQVGVDKAGRALFDRAVALEVVRRRSVPRHALSTVA